MRGMTGPQEQAEAGDRVKHIEREDYPAEHEQAQELQQLPHAERVLQPPPAQ